MLPKFGLQLTLFGAMLAGGLALGLVSLGGYYLATGGPERLRREVSGELNSGSGRDKGLEEGREDQVPLYSTAFGRCPRPSHRDDTSTTQRQVPW